MPVVHISSASNEHELNEALLTAINNTNVISIDVVEMPGVSVIEQPGEEPKEKLLYSVDVKSWKMYVYSGDTAVEVDIKESLSSVLSGKPKEFVQKKINKNKLN